MSMNVSHRENLAQHGETPLVASWSDIRRTLYEELPPGVSGLHIRWLPPPPAPCRDCRRRQRRCCKWCCYRGCCQAAKTSHKDQSQHGKTLSVTSL
jgi:hypothetical protein